MVRRKGRKKRMVGKEWWEGKVEKEEVGKEWWEVMEEKGSKLLKKNYEIFS